MAKLRNCLSLKKKIEVIKSAEKNPGITIRELAEWFDCGKTQIAKILKNKSSVLSSYESKAPNTSVKTVTRTSDFSDINKALYEWFCLACSTFFTLMDHNKRPARLLQH